MKKRLSILKPKIHRALIKNDHMENVYYLNVPCELGIKALKADVKAGACQFAGMDQLIEKEKEPRYILISASNLEQGYLAVTYLAAGFNEKHSANMDVMPDDRMDEEQMCVEEWMESPFCIPLIEEQQLQQITCSGGGQDIFAQNDLFMLSNQQRVFFKPYWMECTQHAVCIVSRRQLFGGMGYMGDCNGEFGNVDYFVEGLKYFRGNDKVYILYVDKYMQGGGNPLADDMEDNGEDYFPDAARRKWNHIVLSFSMDEIAVALEKEAEKQYYKLLFQGNMAEKSISVKRGFSYERLVNIVMAMEDENKCALIESIVNYAVRDWTDVDGRQIENSDFDFMDRFCRVCNAKANGGEKKKTARERLMQELIGLEKVKKQVLDVVNVMKYNRIRAQMGIVGGGYHNVHLMLGAPGTAKTTVAQLMGQIMVEEHLLPDNRFTCVNGAELKGMYVGHSAPKTKALFENNDIIVIDEAYSLVGDHGDNDSFTKEALAQLIIELENHSTDKLVIFAGYGGKNVNRKDNKMKDFLDANPGIKSRITSTIYFDSYSPDELVEIFLKIAKNNQYDLSGNVRGIVRAYFAKRIQDENFGNGREARSLLETVVIYAASRVLGQNKRNYTRAEMQAILFEDVEKAIRQAEYADSVRNAENRKGDIHVTWRQIG